MPEPYRKDLRIKNETKNLSLVRQVVGEILERTPFGKDDKAKIILAVDEALANVVEHAYGGNVGDIDIQFILDDERFQITIRDNGERFNPEMVATPDIHKHIKDGLKGGLGMFLMRKIMDEVRYSLDSTYVNELVMVKFCPSA